MFGQFFNLQSKNLILLIGIGKLIVERLNGLFVCPLNVIETINFCKGGKRHSRQKGLNLLGARSNGFGRTWLIRDPLAVDLHNTAVDVLSDFQQPILAEKEEQFIGNGLVNNCHCKLLRK